MMCASADASLRMKTATVTAKHAAEAYLGLSPILIGLQIIVVVVFIPLAMRGGTDFRQLYTAGYMVRAGYSSRLYDYNVQKDLQNKLVSPAQIALPFNHLAYEALLFAPPICILIPARIPDLPSSERASADRICAISKKLP